MGQFHYCNTFSRMLSLPYVPASLLRLGHTCVDFQHRGLVRYITDPALTAYDEEGYKRVTGLWGQSQVTV